MGHHFTSIHSKDSVPIQTEAPLSEKEREAYQILSKIKGGSPWHYGIRTAFDKGTTAAFRKLIKEMKEQAQGSQVIMELIIGYRAYQAIMNA